MGTIAEKLNKVVESKSAIKTAITNKGGNISDSTPFSQYATIISGLPEAISGVTYSDNTLFISKSNVDINITSSVQNININSGGGANIVNSGGIITATNLSAENIKNGINILGVAGTYETPTETKSVTPTKSSQTITPSTGKHLSSVTVYAIPSNYIIPSGTKSVTENGTYDVTNYASVSVDVESGGSVIVNGNTHNDYY